MSRLYETTSDSKLSITPKEISGRIPVKQL